MSFAVATRRSALTMGRRMAARRFESTTTQKVTETAKETASKAKETASKAKVTASEYATKAQEGLSRVTSAAGPAILNAAKGVSGALGKVGGRTGRLVSFAERQLPFVMYYSKVGMELAKIVFRGQNMTPPSMATFQSYFQNVFRQLRNPSALLQAAQKTAPSNPTSVLQAVRNLSRAQLIAAGVILAECLGFFTVGEMIGRMKIIGYHGETGAAHH
ncbi:ATP synthase subunit G, mitochondrial [Diplogelasinospora grovesii]|uniref:ATP synthase subunit G, mitochondrial n=1 Tax=Diplogelasinospora grovesii TaxID=303347 RepID=A0AAN6NDE9_9PEZI|nr:ATP synthase subunit G, mitochondrial [Diplogelasinospora grovesii]